MPLPQSTNEKCNRHLRNVEVLKWFECEDGYYPGNLRNHKNSVRPHKTKKLAYLKSIETKLFKCYAAWKNLQRGVCIIQHLWKYYQMHRVSSYALEAGCFWDVIYLNAASWTKNRFPWTSSIRKCAFVFFIREHGSVGVRKQTYQALKLVYVGGELEYNAGQLLMLHVAHAAPAWCGSSATNCISRTAVCISEAHRQINQLAKQKHLTGPWG